MASRTRASGPLVGKRQVIEALGAIGRLTLAFVAGNVEGRHAWFIAWLAFGKGYLDSEEFWMSQYTTIQHLLSYDYSASISV